MGVPARLLIVLLIALFQGIDHAWAEEIGGGHIGSGNSTIGLLRPAKMVPGFDSDTGRSRRDNRLGLLRLAEDREKKSDAGRKSGGKTPVGDAEETVWRSDVLKILAIGMGIGDVTGGGKNEVVLIDPRTVYLYRVEGGKMNLVTEYQAGALELKSVDVACVRKQGPCRIYVSAQNRGTASSFVLEYRNGGLIPVIQNIHYFLRAILYPTKGPILLGQRKGLNRLYEGPIFRLEDKGDDLEVRERFGVPLKIPIFGFAIGDFTGKHTPLIAAYDRDDHLRVYEPSGKRLFISREYYGGSDIPMRKFGPEVRRGQQADEEQGKEFFRPRIMSLDLDKDHKFEILAIAHGSKTQRLLSRTKMLDEGQVLGLVWNGDALEEKWASPKIQGILTDFTVDYLPGFTGKRLITVERKLTDWLSFLRSESQVRVYNLEDLIGGKFKDRKSD